MKVFATRVWGFDPVLWPVITFNREGNRDKLLLASAPGDVIVFVGTQNDPTPEAMRGRLLGMAEISRRPVDTEDVIGQDARSPSDLDEHGRFRWPKAIFMMRAWQFDPQPILRDVLAEQLPYNATPQAVLLSDGDANAVLALPRLEIALPETVERTRAQLLDRALGAARPTTGVVPASWEGTTGRDANRQSFTYAFRFGTSSVWKIGHSIDLSVRLSEVNQHIPFEITGQHWKVVFRQRWETELDAYAMEQRVLSALEGHRTEGERVRCSEDELSRAWRSAIGI